MNFVKETNMRTFTALGIGSAILVSAAGVLLYQYSNWNKYDPREAQISPFLQNQSILIDSKSGTRISVRGDVLQTAPELQTYFDIFRQAEKDYGNQPCMGLRQSFEDPIKWQTYNEVGQEIRAMGSALLPISEKLQSNVVGIYSRNCPQWVSTMFACSAYGLVLIPIYETLGQEAMEHVLKETQMLIAVCYTVEQAQRLITTTGSCVTTVIVINAKPEQVLTSSSEFTQKSVRWFAYDALIKEGKKHPVSLPVVNPSDLRMICYTSGSTGQPKGVMQTHCNSVMILRSLLKSLDCYIALLKGNMTHLSHLPLAHGFEQMGLSLSIYIGAEIGFLTENHSGLIKDCMTYKPHILTAVPRIIDRIYSESTKLFRSHTLLNRWLESTIERRMEEQKRGIFRKRGLIDWLLFKQLREMLGGRVELVVCGSAPIAKEAARFIRVALSCQFIEGFGSTESGDLVSLTLPGECTHGHVGALTPSAQVKLVDVPDMDIIASRDNRGEIAIKCLAVTPGYYKNEEKTKQLFDSDGFLLMGDIGSWTPEGALRIEDRCKNIFKLAQGEYVSAEKVECIYSESALVENVLIDGSSLQSFAVAIVVPNLPELRKCLMTKYSTGSNETNQMPNFKSCSDTELIGCKQAKQLVLENLNSIGRSRNLCGFEQARALHLSLDAFTIKNGLLTPTMKLSRSVARKHFAPALAAIYKECEIHNSVK